MSKTRWPLFGFLIIWTFFSNSAPALAQATGGPSSKETTPPGANRPPEQAAIDACQGKKEGERVMFTDSKGKKRRWICVPVGDVVAARSGVATPAFRLGSSK